MTYVLLHLLCGELGGDGGFEGGGGLQVAGALLYGAHDAEEVTAIDLLDVGGGEAFFEQGSGKGGELVVRGELRGDAADAVEVGADADVIDAGDLDGVGDLGDDIGEGGGRKLGGGFGLEGLHRGIPGGGVCDLHGFHEAGAELGQEGLGGVKVALGEVAAVEVDLDGASLGGEGAEHVVGHVAGVVGEGAAAGVGGDEGGGGDLEGVVEGLVGGVGDVDHHAEAVHLADDVFAEGGEAVVVL